MFVITNNDGAVISVYSSFDSANKAVHAQFRNLRNPYAETRQNDVGYCGIVAEWKYYDIIGDYRMRVTQLNGRMND